MLAARIGDSDGVGPHHLRAAVNEPPTRQHRLAGKLGSIDVKGTAREQWQYEVSGATRIWYAIDDDDETIWLTAASVGHPKRTE